MPTFRVKHDQPRHPSLLLPSKARRLPFWSTSRNILAVMESAFKSTCSLAYTRDPANRPTEAPPTKPDATIASRKMKN